MTGPIDVTLPLRVIRCLLLLLALLAIVATAIPGILGTMSWWVRYLDYPRLEFLIGMLLIWLLLALLPRSRVTVLAMLGLAGACAYDAYVLFPYTTTAESQEVAMQSCPPQDKLTLLEVNVRMTNQQYERLLDIVRQAKPDIAWFQETDARWVHELSPLADTMPYHVAAPQPNYFGVELYSRLKLIDPRVNYLTGSANPSVFAKVQLQSGEMVKLYAIHPRPPLQGQGVAERNAQLMAAALDARDDSEPHVMLGDMNAVPWEGIIHHAERVGRFLDPRVGRGLFITWNTNSLVLRWPLDQILPGPGFSLVSLQVLPPFGSDHRPYLAVLCRGLAAGVEQSVPPLQSGDIQNADVVVQKGMGRADKTGFKGKGEPGGNKD